VRLDQLKQPVEIDLLIESKDRLQLMVQVDVSPLLWVLQAVALDVLPKGSDHSCAGFFMQSKDFGERVT
jgi:predicted extracellular nuclease